MKLILLLCFLFNLASCDVSNNRKNKHLEKGIAYLADNNTEKARIEFKNVMQIDPKFAEVYYYMGRLEEKNKQLSKALAFYNGAIELEPDYLEAKVSAAKIYLVAGTKSHIEKSSSILDEVLQNDPGNPEARLILSTIDYKSGKQEKAINDIEALLDEHVDMLEAISLLATIYSSRGELQKALNVLEKGINKNSNDIPLRMSYAKLLSSSNNNSAAERQLEEIIRIKPEDYSFRIALSRFYTFNKQIDKAESVLRKAINDKSDDAERYLKFIEFISDNDSAAEAEVQLKAFIVNNPSMYELQFSLYEMYQGLGENNKAKKILEEIIKNRFYDKEGVRARLKLSELFLSENDLSISKSLVDAVLVDYPSDNDALLISGKIQVLNNDLPSAINSFRSVLKNQPENTEVSFLLANAHYLNKSHDLAENVLKRSIESAPKDSKAYLNYAQYLFNNNKFEESYAVLDKSLGLFSSDYELMEVLISISDKIKSDPKKIKLLNVMQKKYPKLGESYIKKGKNYLSSKKYSNALIEFEKAYIAMTEKTQSLELVVKTYLEERRFDNAITRLNSAADEMPKSALPYHLLGVVFKSMGDIEKAQENFTHAIEINSTWLVPYMALSTLYVDNNEIKNAINVYQKAINNNLNIHVVKMKLAELYVSQEDYQSAAKLYEEILSTNPRNLMVINKLALLLVDTMPDKVNLERALQLVNKFTGMKQPVFKDTLGWVYVKTGETDKAIAVLEEVVNSSPSIVLYKYHLAVALNNAGKFERAKSLLTQVIESDQEFLNRQSAVQLLKQL